MKKLTLSVVIATIILSLVGCGTKSNSEIEDVNKKLEDAYATIDKLEENVNELSNKIDSSSELKVKEYTDKEQQITPKITINDSGYDGIIEHIESEGKKVITPKTSFEGSTVFIIRTTEPIKDITINSLEGYIGGDLATYIVGLGIKNRGNLASELKEDEVLVFTAHEPEGGAMNYLSWTEPDGTIMVHALNYYTSRELFSYE